MKRRSLARAGILTFGSLVVMALILSLIIVPEDNQPRENSPDDPAPSNTNSTSLPASSTTSVSPPTSSSLPPATTTTLPPPTTTQPLDYWVDPAPVGQIGVVGRPGGDRQTWGSGWEEGALLTFRGSPTRSYYGTGPVPESPRVAWSYPPSSQEPMCSESSWQGSQVEWCGTGWTGQPAVVPYEGRTWVIFGAYDGAVHFLDAETGEQLLPSFQTGDLIKGSVTVDPDGYPLIYVGSRDDNFRIIAFDREEPAELWRMNAYDVERLTGNRLYWNDDWDSSALVIDDYLFEGGENSSFYIVKLNRGYDSSGRASVSPEPAHVFPGWDEQLLEDIADEEISIESSAAIFKNTLYFANSGGLVQGWDISGLGRDATGWQPERVFRFWTGGDVDASIVIDEEGMLYAGVERERLGEQYAKARARSEEVGQILKLDPSRPEDPIVWQVQDLEPLEENPPGLQTQSGLWATPALYENMLYAATHTGRLLGIDRSTGAICWEIRLGGFLWGSPVVIDDVLLQGDHQGNLRAYDVSGDEGCDRRPSPDQPNLDQPSPDQRSPDTETSADQQTDPSRDSAAAASNAAPPQLWRVSLGWRIESTPAVWNGTIFIGDRNGRFYAVR